MVMMISLPARYASFSLITHHCPHVQLPTQSRANSYHPRFVAEKSTRIASRAQSAYDIGHDTSVSINGDLIDQTTLQALIGDSDDTNASTLTDDDPSTLPNGLIGGFYIVKQYSTPTSFDLSSPMLGAIDAKRVELTDTNVTLPIALMLIDPAEYPSLSKARKTIRQKKIVLHRSNVDNDVKFPRASFERPAASIGRVLDRVQPGDIIGVQNRLSHGIYSRYVGLAKPSFDLPVLYEDDHVAIVHKPPGVAIYNGRDGGHGRNTIRYALPHVLKPPKQQKSIHSNGGADAKARNVLKRPVACHRLDMPTSGVLVVAKTYDAVVDVTRQFEHRIVRKTYAAILNGRLEESIEENTISSQEAYDLGVDVDPSDSKIRWQVIRDVQEGKEALTVWRSLRYCRSTKAADGFVTLVELKPKTGRKHQLRRHMAWNYDRHIVGDTTYGTAYDAKRWGRGLMLTSCHIALHHPYYSNTKEGRTKWEKLSSIDNLGVRRLGEKLFQATKDSPVVLEVSVDLPNKFTTFLQTEERRAAEHSDCQ